MTCTYVRSAVGRTVGIGGAMGLFVVAAPANAAFSPGSPGLGDPLLPLAGNGGYDVGHYGLTLSYEPDTHVLDGRALITAEAEQDLSQFDLALRGFDIPSLTVNGRPAAFARDGQEL